MSQYQRLCRSFSWNKGLTIPIIPMVHAADYQVLKNICGTGFGSPCETGWYGAGIYFTSSIPYFSSYLQAAPAPAILISFVVPGNIYPAVEHHLSNSTLRGQPIRSGHNSHYAICQKDGTIAQFPLEKNEQIFNELVVPQESQTAPIYLVKLAPPLLNAMLQDFKRELSVDRSQRSYDSLISALEDF